MKFYICKHCGNIIAYVHSSGVPVVCCGEPMQEIIPGTTDGALEKHVPVIEVEGNKVTVRVGAVEHPMLPEHYIEWIAFAARGSFRTPRHPKNVSRTGRYGARFFISIALFQPARPCRAPQAARRPHLWKRLKRAVKSCPVYSISWFRVLYWKSSGECISAARTYAGKGAFSE